MCRLYQCMNFVLTKRNPRPESHVTEEKKGLALAQVWWMYYPPHWLREGWDSVNQKIPSFQSTMIQVWMSASTLLKSLCSGACVSPHLLQSPKLCGAQPKIIIDTSFGVQQTSVVIHMSCLHTKLKFISAGPYWPPSLSEGSQRFPALLEGEKLSNWMKGCKIIHLTIKDGDHSLTVLSLQREQGRELCFVRNKTNKERPLRQLLLNARL